MYSRKYRKLLYYKNVNEKIPPNELNEIKGKLFLEQYANFIIEDRGNLTNVTIDIENYIHRTIEKILAEREGVSVKK